MSSEIISPEDRDYEGELEAKSILGKYLTPGETLQWSGKPQVRWKQDLRRGIPIIGFFLALFLFFLVNFASQRTNAGSAQTSNPVPIQQGEAPAHQQGPSPLFVVIVISALAASFLSFWCYMMFRGLGGQKLLNLFSLSKTYYGLTEYRVIVVAGKKEFRVLSYHLRCVQGLRLREEPDGVGTINLGPRDRSTNPFQVEDAPPLVLKNIPRAAFVFGLIFKAQDKLLR